MHQFKEIQLFYVVNYSMHVLITVFDPVICKTPDAPLHCLPFCKVKW